MLIKLRVAEPIQLHRGKWERSILAPLLIIYTYDEKKYYYKNNIYILILEKMFISVIFITKMKYFSSRGGS